MVDATTPLNRNQLSNKKIIAHVWDNIWEWGVADRAYRLANAEYQVVLAHATHLYFDHPQEVSPDERGYYWASRYNDTKKVFGYMPDDIYANADKTRMGDPITDLEKLVGRPLPALQKPANILGMQGNVWSETIRNEQQLEQKIYPRLLMMAERAWHKAEWEGVTVNKPLRDAQWSEMSQLLALRELPKLQKQGVAVYLPPPGVQIIDGKASANTALPGLIIDYSLNQGKTWSAYISPIPILGTICFRSYATANSYSRQQCVSKTQ
jgi:hexosaminidase